MMDAELLHFLRMNVNAGSDAAGTGIYERTCQLLANDRDLREKLVKGTAN
jgi:hypothetical protein